MDDMKLDMEDIKIRCMDVNDVDPVFSVEMQCFSTPWSRESFEYEMKENDKAIYVIAEYGGNVLGYAGMWKILDEDHITNIAVLREFRQKGIATMLIKKLLDLAKEASINSFTLEVKSTNDVAIKLYENFGFKKCGLRKGYYKDTQDDALIMWKR